MPLDTANLTPSASLNRVPFVPLPGLPFPAEYMNKSAFDLLSAQAIAERVRRNCQILCLELEDGRDPLPAFDHCFLSSDPVVRQVAEQIAEALGHALGYLMLTLKRGDSISRVNRPEWDDSYWAQWGQVNQVWLGGGIVSGLLGHRLAEYAQNFINSTGLQSFWIAVSPHDMLMPLVGLARHVPPETLSALVFDFGGSSIKRAVARYSDSSLCALHPFPSMSTTFNTSTLDGLGQATLILEQLLDVIGHTHDALSGESIATIGISLACYLHNGQPYNRGCYGSLSLITDDLQGLLAAELARRLKKPVSLILMHDGTAAASARAGERHSAIVMLGTALGVGFPALKTLPIRVTLQPSRKIGTPAFF